MLVLVVYSLKNIFSSGSFHIPVKIFFFWIRKDIPVSYILSVLSLFSPMVFY